MEYTAKLKYVRVTPRKVGVVADSIRGKGINEVLLALRFSPQKRIAGMLYELVKSAAANAGKSGTVDVDNLYVKTMLVGSGPILKRFRPRAKGSAFRINKRTSHISVILAEK